MAATDAQIVQLRRMIHEPDDTTYSDDDLAAYIEAYPLTDELGNEWQIIDESTRPPSYDANPDWIPGYDLNQAAADLWEEKAAVVAQDYTFIADGGVHTRSQVYTQYMGMARHYRARRAPGAVKVFVSPKPRTPTVWVGNAAEGAD